MNFIDELLESTDLLDAVEYYQNINESLFHPKKKEREEIVKNSKSYISVFERLGCSVEENVNNSRHKDDSIHWFLTEDNNHFLLMKVNDQSKKNLEKISQKIKELNSKIDNFYFALKYENSIWVYEGSEKSVANKAPTESQHKEAITVAKKVLSKYSSIKSAISFEPYKIDEDDLSTNIIHYDTWNIKWSQNDRRTEEEYEKLFEDPFNQFYKELKVELSKSNIKIYSDGDEDTGIIYIKK